VRLTALHHVTAICSDARRTVEFYRGLGFRLVKKTVNFDDPGSYHLYFGDGRGSPGTLVTFFEWPRAYPGRLGRGSYETIALTTPEAREVRRLEDPDGLRLELHPGEAPALHHVSAYGDPSVYPALLAEDAPLRFVDGPSGVGMYGPGVTHHIAWRARDEAEQLEWQRHVNELGLRPTEVQDRKYFRSIYFRLPDGLLFEIATDGPGFAVDEPAESLGQSLSLPDWLEPRRETIARHLQPV
jgi:glyoxalase family protein